MNELLEPLVYSPADISVAEWARRITASWRKSVEAILETGRLIVEAKEALAHGVFGAMIDNELPFGRSTAQRLMAIARDPRITALGQQLPADWRALYEITRLDDEQIKVGIIEGVINPQMQRSDISTAVKQRRRENAERVLGELQGHANLVLPDKRYGVILADPEWKFETWSEKGMDRAAANHYPTSALEVLKARPVQGIAAADCVLFLWVTAPFLHHGLDVLAAWSFEYKSHFVWLKDHAIHGYWNRSAHELLLVGTRGKIPCPAEGTQACSVLDGKRGKHSQKPDCFYELIEFHFPHLAKIELNARKRRAGWDSWGNEVLEEAAA